MYNVWQIIHLYIYLHLTRFARIQHNEIQDIQGFSRRNRP